MNLKRPDNVVAGIAASRSPKNALAQALRTARPGTDRKPGEVPWPSPHPVECHRLVDPRRSLWRE